MGKTQGQEGTFASHGPAWVSRCQEELAEVGTISECKAASHTQELQDRCTRTGMPRQRPPLPLFCHLPVAGRLVGWSWAWGICIPHLKWDLSGVPAQVSWGATPGILRADHPGSEPTLPHGQASVYLGLKPTYLPSLWGLTPSQGTFLLVLLGMGSPSCPRGLGARHLRRAVLGEKPAAQRTLPSLLPSPA